MNLHEKKGLSPLLTKTKNSISWPKSYGLLKNDVAGDQREEVSTPRRIL
jgi:hypothetical protein